MVAIFGKPKTTIAFAHSVIGQSHIKSKKPCQDASLCVKDKKYTFVAVADGHGGDKYFRSDVGSRLAVEQAKISMTNPDVLNALKVTKQGKDRERVIEQIKKSIIMSWGAGAWMDEDENHFTDEELAGAGVSDEFLAKYHGEEKMVSEHIFAYGTTLIAVLQTDTFLLVLQIGDGNCIIVDKDGTFSQPVPACEKCFLNITTSLCEENAIDNFRHAFVDEPPAAVLIGSDGIDDCFAGEEKLYDFYRLILSSFKEKAEEAAKIELIDYLPRLSEKGSGDDISIGVIADKEALQKLSFEIPTKNMEGDNADGSECNTGEMLQAK